MSKWKLWMTYRKDSHFKKLQELLWLSGSEGGSALFLFSWFLFTISCSVCIFSLVLSQMYLVTAGKFLPSLILKVCSFRSGSIYTLLSLWRSIQCHWGGTGGGATEETARWRWKGNGGRTAQRSNCLLWYLFSQCVCDGVNWWKS